jgi:hypothetical protein
MRKRASGSGICFHDYAGVHGSEQGKKKLAANPSPQAHDMIDRALTIHVD